MIQNILIDILYLEETDHHYLKANCNIAIIVKSLLHEQSYSQIH